MPLYEQLTKNSTPEQIAAAYGEFTSGAGGDTAANRNEAQTFLQSRGIAAPIIGQAYEQYKQPVENVPTGIQTLAGPTYQGLTSASTPDQIANAYSQFIDTAGGNTLANQKAAEQYLNKIGVAKPTIQSAYNNYLSDAPLYQSLTSQSTPDQIASAYRQFAKGAGGDAQANQQAAVDYLRKIGVADTTTQDAYQNYLGKEAAASDLYKQFGVSDGVSAPTQEGILSGFKYAKDSGLSEDALKETLGEDVYNTYRSGFSDYAKTGLANILADKKLSFDEASTAVKFGREYGYDSQKLADLTGQKKEIFDNINKTYDDTSKKIVNSVLNAEDVKTDGDKIIRALALQQRYGFNDDDLAKATNFTPAQVKEYLEPARNYGTAYKEIMSKPDVTGNEILGFLEESKKNQGITTAYGSNIDGQITKLKELNDKWKGFKDGYQAENIYNQINKITEAVGGKNWTGSWRSGGDNATKETVRLLMDKGVDNLSDLAVQKNKIKADADVSFYNGQLVRTDDDGRKYVAPPNLDPSIAPVTYLPPDAKTTPGRTEIDDQDNGTTRPLTEQELKTYDPKTNKFDTEAFGSKLIDKSTGKVVAEKSGIGLGRFFEAGDPNKFVLNRYETGNFLKGKSKELGIMMTEQGIPVPYQTTEKDGLVYSPVFPIMLSMLAPGIGSAISGALPGAGIAATGAAEGAFLAGSAPTMANTIATNAIMGGGIAGLTGQDPLKGALLGGIGAPRSSGISSLLPSGLDPALAKALTS